MKNRKKGFLSIFFLVSSIVLVVLYIFLTIPAIFYDPQKEAIDWFAKWGECSCSESWYLIVCLIVMVLCLGICIMNIVFSSIGEGDFTANKKKFNQLRKRVLRILFEEEEQEQEKNVSSANKKKVD